MVLTIDAAGLAGYGRGKPDNVEAGDDVSPESIEM